MGNYIQSRLLGRGWNRQRVGARFRLRKILVLAWVLILGACAHNSTKIDRVWSAPGSGAYTMGRTMVIVYTRNPAVSGMVESVIVRELQDQEVAAVGWHSAVPGVHAPSRRQVVPVVTSGGYTSVLSVNVLDVKQVERDYPASQVARAEVKLFSVVTQKLVWSMAADTYVRTIAATNYIMPQEADVQKFSEALTAELIRSGIL